MNNLIESDSLIDLDGDIDGSFRSGQAAPAVFQSFQLNTKSAPSLPLLDPAPPTCVVGRGLGAALGAGEVDKVVEKTAGAERKKYKGNKEVGRLGSRDLEVLKLLIEQRYLDLNRISKIFFFDDKANAKRRLRQLIHSQYVKREMVETLTSEITLFLPTEKGRRAIEEEFGPVDALPKSIVPSHIKHNLLVTDVRLRLKDFWKCDWIPETALKPQNLKLVPDGVLKFKNTGHKVAIELENAIKSRERYFEIFRNYRDSEYVLSIYVCTFDQIFERLKSQLLENSYEAPIGLFKWDELKNGAPLLWTPAGMIDLLKKEEL